METGTKMPGTPIQDDYDSPILSNLDTLIPDPTNPIFDISQPDSLPSRWSTTSQHTINKL